jgi:hypothetical protein
MGSSHPLLAVTAIASIGSCRPGLLTVPVDAVAGLVCDLLETCFQIREREPLDFNFVRA